MKRNGKRERSSRLFDKANRKSFFCEADFYDVLFNLKINILFIYFYVKIKVRNSYQYLKWLFNGILFSISFEFNETLEFTEIGKLNCEECCGSFLLWKIFMVKNKLYSIGVQAKYETSKTRET